MSELSEQEYDTIVLGTGLAESIIAASLAKSSQKVLHIDPFPTYGGTHHSSLTIPELLAHLPSLPSSSFNFPNKTEIARSVVEGSTGRRYALSLYPGVIPARGALIDTLIATGVSGYVGFRIVDGVAVHDGQCSSDDPGKMKKVPSSKGEVFKDKSMSLVEKRKLMKMLMYVGGFKQENDEVDTVIAGKENMPFVDFLKAAFQLSDSMARDVAYGIAHCTTTSEPALPTVLRLQKYLLSLSRYSSTSSFLVAQFGGIGEIVQGFCRSCAVHGGTYILGPMATVRRLESKDGRVELEVACQDETISAKRVIASRKSLRELGSVVDLKRFGKDTRQAGRNGFTYTNCIAVVPSLPATIKNTFGNAEGDAEEAGGNDVILVVIPPGDQTGQVSRVLFMGGGTGSCPDGQYVMYVQTPIKPETDISPEDEVKPILDLIYGPDSAIEGMPLFTAYYRTKDIYEVASGDAGSMSDLDSETILLDDVFSMIAKESPGTPAWLEGMNDEAEIAARTLGLFGIDVMQKVSKEEEEEEELV